MKKLICVLSAATFALFGLTACGSTSSAKQSAVKQTTAVQTTAEQVTTVQATTAQPTAAQPTTVQATTAQSTTAQQTTAQPTAEQVTAAQPTAEQTTAVDAGKYTRTDSQSGWLTISNVNDSGFDFVVEAATSGEVPNVGKVVGTADKISDTEYKFIDTEYPKYGYEMTFTVNDDGSITIEDKLNEGVYTNPYAGFGVTFEGTFEK